MRLPASTASRADSVYAALKGARPQGEDLHQVGPGETLTLAGPATPLPNGVSMAVAFSILIITTLLFLWDRLPMEIVGLLSLLALVLTNTLSPSEALAGFSNGIVITLAGLFVVGGALMKTGVAGLAGEFLERFSAGDPRRMLWLVIGLSAMLSSVMSSTATAAVLIPVVVAAAQRNRWSPSAYLIPLAYGSLIGGMLTLIGTAPNLVVDAALRGSGRPGFQFFTFAPFGLALLLVTVVYLSLLGERILPNRLPTVERDLGPTLESLTQDYNAFEDLHWVQLPSSWDPRSLATLRLRSDYHVEVLGVEERGTGLVTIPNLDTVLSRERRLLVRSGTEALARFLKAFGGLTSQYSPDERPLPAGRGVAEILLTPRSKMLGKSLAELRFSTTYGVRVHKVRRSGVTLEGDVPDIPLRYGDTLLVEGPWEKLQVLQRERFEFVVVGMPKEFATVHRLSRKGGTSLAVLGLMLSVITLGWLPTEIAVLLAAVALVMVNCLTVEEAYASIHWSSLVLVAAMLAMASALSKTGALDELTRLLIATTGGYGPYGVLVGFFLLTATLSQVISNTATTLILAPMAVDAAERLTIAPEPLLIAVAIAASAAFSTPIASPVNTLVLGPGGYRFRDFLKAGLPLQILALVIVTALVPWFFPF